MGRPRIDAADRRMSASITLPPNKLAWLDDEATRRHITRSALIERIVDQLMRQSQADRKKPPLPGMEN